MTVAITARNPVYVNQLIIKVDFYMHFFRHKHNLEHWTCATRQQHTSHMNNLNRPGVYNAVFADQFGEQT